MKILFDIPPSRFEDYKNFVKDNISTDFYSVNKDRQTKLITKQDNEMIFNVLDKWGIDELNQHLARLDDDAILVRSGFCISEAKQIYSYATHSGTTWGVAKQDDKYLLFFMGISSFILRIPFLAELVEEKAEPILMLGGKNVKTLKKGKKKTFKWYERKLIKAMFDREKAVIFLAKKDLSNGLSPVNQIIWDKWVDNDFVVDILNKQKELRPNHNPVEKLLGVV